MDGHYKIAITYYVLGTVTRLRLFILYTTTTCSTVANITLITALLLCHFLLLRTVRVDCAVQATQTVCTSKTLKAKQLRSGDWICTRNSRTTQHYMDLYRALCTTWKTFWKDWLSKKIGDGDLLKKAKNIWTVVKHGWLSNKFLSSWEAVLGKNRTEHNKAATLTLFVVSPVLSSSRFLSECFSGLRTLRKSLNRLWLVYMRTCSFITKWNLLVWTEIAVNDHEGVN